MERRSFVRAVPLLLAGICARCRLIVRVINYFSLQHAPLVSLLPISYAEMVEAFAPGRPYHGNHESANVIYSGSGCRAYAEFLELVPEAGDYDIPQLFCPDGSPAMTDDPNEFVLSYRLNKSCVNGDPPEKRQQTIPYVLCFRKSDREFTRLLRFKNGRIEC